jgi:sodium-coupled monocarboxylate transporter 8/12
MGHNSIISGFHLENVLGILFYKGIGIFFACRGRKQKTSSELLLANREMGLFPTSMSLLASFMSGITILGNPAEVYNYGTCFWWAAVSYLFVTLVTAKIFIPLFLSLNITSGYEYLERRFNRYVRLLASFIFMFQMVRIRGILFLLLSFYSIII